MVRKLFASTCGSDYHLRESSVLSPDKLVLIETGSPLGERATGNGLVEELDGLDVVLHHLAVGVEPGVGGQVRDIEGSASWAPVTVALGHGKLDPAAIAALVGII